jgi:hypothetical protein
MKYELIKFDVANESKADTEGNYNATITIGIKCIDNIAPDFSKDIASVSNNSQTGTEVDLQRQTEVENYLILINA